jgi:hypothetical protein
MMVCANIFQLYRGGANCGGRAGDPSSAMVVMLVVPAVSLLTVKMRLKAHPFLGRRRWHTGIMSFLKATLGISSAGLAFWGPTMSSGFFGLVAFVRAFSSFSFFLSFLYCFALVLVESLRRREVTFLGSGPCPNRTERSLVESS